MQQIERRLAGDLAGPDSIAALPFEELFFTIAGTYPAFSEPEKATFWTTK